MGEERLIEPGLAQRALVRALAKGGEWAEVFCEERTSLAASIDESRVENAQRGAERGAGIQIGRAHV